KIATDDGSIVWSRAEVVYADDRFEYCGPAEAPVHHADPFKDNRGDIVGAYCIAKTNDGDVLTEDMSQGENEKIRSKSSAWVRGQAGRKGPWEEFFSEMCRKAVVKRASKTWPYTDQSEAIGQAVAIANDAEGGYSFESEEEKAFKRQQTHDAALGRHYISVQLIKEQLGQPDPDYHSIAEMWGEIPQNDQMALWLAPSKGGIFTTAERNAIKTQLPRIQQETAE